MNDKPVHAPLPLGLGSQVTLTGFIGAVVAFIIAWVQDGMTPETVTLGATAGGLIAAWFAGRSIQAKAAIDTAVGAYLPDEPEPTDEPPPDVPVEPPPNPGDPSAPDEGDGGSNVGPDGKPIEPELPKD